MSDARSVTFVIARVGRERVAIDVEHVFEAVDAAGLDRVPQLPAGAVGVLPWRGVVHTVWSPERVLRVAPEAPGTVLFLRAGDGLVAMAVDDADDLITLPHTAIRAMPGIEDGAGLIRGGVQAGDVFAAVVDPGMLVAALTGAAPAAERNA